MRLIPDNNQIAPLLANGIPLKPEHIAAAVVGLVEDDSKAGEALVVAEPA